jgi:hypothetical protein
MTDTLTPDPRNPNRMADDDKAMLARSLSHWGDLSGIVINRRTGLLIGGHQRTSVMPDGQLVTEDLPEPEPDGTVARGYLEHLGRRYAVRVVDWSEDEARAALLAANRFGRIGADDPAMLKDLLAELDDGQRDMGLTGFDEAAMEQLMTQAPPDFAPGTEDDQGKLDELAPKMVCCPKCGDRFDAREQL